MLQQTLVLIKPEAMKKKLTGYILNKFAEKDINIVGIKTVKVSKELAEKHYEHLKSKPFFAELINYLQGVEYDIDYILAIVYEGENCIQNVRDITGATNPEEANPTTIRGAFGRITTKGVFENVVHSSSSIEDAEKEIKLWFAAHELTNTIYETEIKKIEKNELTWK
jgi:nucleoside-diphosphate kinase